MLNVPISERRTEDGPKRRRSPNPDKIRMKPVRDGENRSRMTNPMTGSSLETDDPVFFSPNDRT
jgi:hypothetical protein